MKRMRVIMEIDVDRGISRELFDRSIFNSAKEHFPGLVYLATEIADTDIVSHDGKHSTSATD